MEVGENDHGNAEYLRAVLNGIIHGLILVYQPI